MKVRDWGAPFRVGATSYIIEDDLVANAAFLAPHVQDMQLVLFDLPGGPGNLPDAATVAALAALGDRHDLTYTVHLVHDIGATSPASLASAQDVISRTRALAPHAWVGHLDGRAVRELDPAATAAVAWRAATIDVVTQVGAWTQGTHRLAVENLEGYPAEFVTPVVTPTQAGRCVDVGHLWLDDHDPIGPLEAAWPRLRVVHLHGVAPERSAPNRDHRSVALAPPARLDSVVHLLLRRRFTGVLTLEIFGEADFWSSLAALEASVRRFQA